MNYEDFKNQPEIKKLRKTLRYKIGYQWMKVKIVIGIRLQKIALWIMN